VCTGIKVIQDPIAEDGCSGCKDSNKTRKIKGTLCTWTVVIIVLVFSRTFILLLWWGETMSLWNCDTNRPTAHPPDDTGVNMEHW
jgi:hypothetical protein